LQVCAAPIVIAIGLWRSRDKIISRDARFKSRFGILFGTPRLFSCFPLSSVLTEALRAYCAEPYAANAPSLFWEVSAPAAIRLDRCWTDSPSNPVSALRSRR
jgi:hypothetical protein